MTNEIYLKNSLKVNNSIITLGDTDDSGKGRHFKSRFIQPGLAGYPGQYGNALIKKENLDKFVYTLRNKPVIINHKEEIEEKDKVGEVFNVWFNPDDGWYWCDGVITDVTAQNLIQDKGWSVSCSYDFTSYNDEGGTENNIPYDIEFLDGEFTHLAIVDNPRYERANILFNSKGAINMNIQNKNENEKGEWITVKGTHIFIPDGKTAADVIKEKGWGSGGEKSKETNSTKDFRNHLGRIEKLIKKYNLEPHEEDELLDELGSFEAKLDEGLEPREEEALREELFDFEEDIKRHHEMDKDESKSKGEDKQDKSQQPTISQKPDVNKYQFKNYKNPDAFLQGHMKQCETYKDTFDYVLKETDRKFENVKKTYWGNTPPEKQFRIELGNINGHNAVRDLMDSWANRNRDYKPLIDDIKTYQQDLLKQLEGYNKWNGKEWIKDNKTNNSKETDMALIEELKKLITKVENDKGELMEDKEKKEIDNEKVDKRKLIDEVGGILKGKVDDEIIRTIIKKMEEASYDESEAGSADNKKVKNESEEEKEDKKAENKKVKNEESEDDKEKVEELKEEEKEDVENKCNNSKTDFYDKMNKIYNSALKPDKSETEFVSRADRLKAGEEYFKV